MKLAIVNGVACVERTVENINVYSILRDHTIQGIPTIMHIKDNTVFYQYINGRTLREKLENSPPFDLPELTSFIYQIALILEELKAINVVHKDLKPENIVISQENKVYLIDFNVSRIHMDKNSDTTLFGTRGYASPEHFGYSSTSFKSDMFSLGKIIEELDVNFHYRDISKRCTEIDPSNRYDNYEDIINDLDSKELDSLLQKEKKPTLFDKLKPLYSKKTLLIYLFIFILVTIIPKSSGEDSDYIPFIINYFFGPLFIIDIIDYIRFIIQKEKRPFIIYKMMITSSLFFLLFLSSIFISTVTS